MSPEVGIEARGLAIDTVSAKVYWSEQLDPQIGRSDLDGSHRDILLDTVRFPHGSYGMALDVEAGKMYWIQVTDEGHAIQRANLDGTQVEVVPAVADTPSKGALALDLTCCRLCGGVAPPLASPGDCAVDVDDLACVLSGSADSALSVTSDLFPCGGDGLVDMDDILAELDAFTGLYARPLPPTVTVA